MRYVSHGDSGLSIHQKEFQRTYSIMGRRHNLSPFPGKTELCREGFLVTSTFRRWIVLIRSGAKPASVDPEGGRLFCVVSPAFEGGGEVARFGPADHDGSGIGSVDEIFHGKIVIINVVVLVVENRT